VAESWFNFLEDRVSPSNVVSRLVAPSFVSRRKARFRDILPGILGHDRAAILKVAGRASHAKIVSCLCSIQGDMFDFFGFRNTYALAMSRGHCRAPESETCQRLGGTSRIHSDAATVPQSRELGWAGARYKLPARPRMEANP